MSESNIKLHFRAIYVPRKLYKSFHFLFILRPHESCHFMPFKWEKHNMESTHTNHIRSVHPHSRQCLPRHPHLPRKQQKNPAKQLPYCYRYLPPSQLLYFPQELISDGPDAAYSKAKIHTSKGWVQIFSLSSICYPACSHSQSLLTAAFLCF